MSLFKSKPKKLSFSHTEKEDGSGYIQIYGTNPTRVATATHEHENYDEIVKAAKDDDERVFELFTPTEMLNRLTSLSDRISYQQGRLYVDGDEASGAIVDHILAAVKEKSPNVEPMVKFYENLLMNPSVGPREQAWKWLEKHLNTITKDGLIVGYKGMDADPEGTWRSKKAGTAYINGVKKEGLIPYAPGDTVTMPRSEVDPNSGEGCSVGIHVGTWKYARSFTHGDVVEVHVHPRDIVSVPSHENEQKMRVCKAQIVDVITEPHQAAVI